MKKIKPMGYERTSMGVFLAIAIVIGAVFIMTMLVGNGASLADMKIFGFAAAILAILCILSDVTTNRKRKQNIMHMEYMLFCPAVKGEVQEIRRIPYYIGKEYPNDPLYQYEEMHVIYRIVVSFQDPATGTEKTIVSEKYRRNVEPYIKDRSVKVHYSPNQEYWIEI